MFSSIPLAAASECRRWPRGGGETKSWLPDSPRKVPRSGLTPEPGADSEFAARVPVEVIAPHVPGPCGVPYSTRSKSHRDIFDRRSDRPFTEKRHHLPGVYGLWSRHEPRLRLNVV